MAVTAIWAIRGRTDHVLSYVMNPQKTMADMASLHAVEDVLKYASSPSKTEEMKFVSGVNCNPDRAVADFRHTKKRWKKTGGIVAFHAYQSFKPGEVAPETAHKIGVALAREMWGDRFEVVVATHLNTDHCHNHIVVNSVSFKDGRRYNDCKETYREIREASDRLCKEYELSVIRNPKGKGKHYAQWSAEKNGKPTYKSLTQQDIDRAIAASVTEKQFWKCMEEMGYTIRLYTQSGEMRKYPSVLAPGAKRAQRLVNLGEGYDYEDIIDRILQNYRTKPLVDPPKERTPKSYRLQGTFPTTSKKGGLWAVHFRYCCYLQRIHKNPTSVSRVSGSLREDLIQMDKLFDQVRYLAKTKFETIEELNERENQIKDRMEELQQERKDLYNAHKRALRKEDPHEVEEVEKKQSSITEEMRSLRKELAMCYAIAERSGEGKLNQIRKEQIDHEPRRRCGRTNRANEPQWS